MTQSRLTTEQLQALAVYHRTNAERFQGPTHQLANREEQTLFYRACQETMAEVFEELVELRQWKDQLPLRAAS